MNLARWSLAALLGVAVAVGATGLGLHLDSPPSLSSPIGYAHDKAAIEAQGREAYAGCGKRKRREVDLCKAQARGQERIRVADLEVRYRGTEASIVQAKIARARAQYDAARVECGRKSWQDRFSCLHFARAMMRQSVVDARPSPP